MPNKHYQETNKKIFYNFFLYIKMTNKYYQKHKENPWKEAHERYQNISEE